MIMISQILFWVPLFIGTLLIIYFTRWTRIHMNIAAFVLVIFLFYLKISTYRHYEPDAYLYFYIAGLFFFTCLLIGYLTYLYRKDQRG